MQFCALISNPEQTSSKVGYPLRIANLKVIFFWYVILILHFLKKKTFLKLDRINLLIIEMKLDVISRRIAVLN
jgi:hypothetical protein